MKLVNTTPDVLKHQIKDAIDKAIVTYRKDYPNEKNYFSRKRVLTFEKMVNLLLSMQGGSLNKELYDAGMGVTASAFVQQRNKLSWTIFEDVFENFNSECNDAKKYKGYRVFAIDGTCVNMARNPKSDSFVQTTNNPHGYNQLHVNPLYDVLNKTYQHCIIQPQPKTDEVGCLAFFLSWYDFKEKTLIVADRGYESYNAFAHFLEHPTFSVVMMTEVGKLSAAFLME